MLKYLRIAVTALGLMACVLLVALWVRSFTWCDAKFVQIGRFQYDVTSLRGCIVFGRAVLQGNAKLTSASIPAAHASLGDLREPYFWFAARKGVSGFCIVLPMWFPILMAVGIASAPWIRRFSLRTLLIATTLVAVVLGLMAVSG
jgi:hypothetical protein